MPELPNEGQPTEQPKQTTEKTDPIKAKIRKKSLGEKFVDTFFADDLTSTISHIWNNVIVPKVKDIMSAAFDTALYGASRNHPVSGNGGGTNYNALSKPQSSVTSSMIIKKNVDDIMLYSEMDVLRLFSALQEQIRLSGYVTLGFLYRYLGMPSDHTKENYGWRQIPTRSYTKSFDEEGKPVYCPILPKYEWLNVNH